ncbi:MAG: tRNA (N(6)-L-threonylcarbamoyladenosine(37)-C(2))-methylthiotransferase MtaB [Candidatus Wallbacteria bacterium GWC2_49_35]|uniref:tRNA (N(6)-L-threonylcarbamoyladenosine(37)-C(2))-methylthiotransferase MtaB n=1 Tax=Candidatus Wallbacteria bacterium GWC2_49_35 TaxID=1817813 RepID=A0A1F7WSY5_9BACT|nr:MAG: tRNA (N(6)-L-threonylcarbamoyladenosine(37)-C(2))-methylthiotransferase MtaB [Candidatus Wallbacteria bacterium GWC2_49_35]HBC74930.1 tRNA (N(6)-L-threonylcarbamoyladenosine(37)-C(2))-methylthiotransferase MtaB [Candidatus Wallbacteria bacterium]
MPKFAVTTLGCKVNQCEEKRISALFAGAGFSETDLKDAADIYIINSCAITLQAEHKARQIVSSIRGRSPEAVIVLAGCYASRLAGEKLKNIDLYVSQSDKDKILDICLAYMKENPTRIGTAEASGVSALPDETYPWEFSGAPSSRTRAQLKIQDGCKSFCSYCIVPYIRKNEYSMPPEEVIGEIDRLTAKGFTEIVLTGIHVGKYSVKDIYGADFSFEQLLKAIDLYPFSRDFRIRLSSIDPSELNERIIYLFKNSPRFVPHFHVALQSGSDRILKLMNRKYSRSEFVEKIKLIKDNIELPAITSDVIVGFPSETEDDFNDTCSLLDEFGFYDFHIFQYSDRPGTAASRMENKVGAAEKKARSKKLHELKYKKNSIYYNGNIGREAVVIAETIVSRSADGAAVLRGHSERYIETTFSGTPDMAGKMVRVLMLSPAEDGSGMLARLL